MFPSSQLFALRNKLLLPVREVLQDVNDQKVKITAYTPITQVDSDATRNYDVIRSHTLLWEDFETI